ncbi:LysR substrate-binding domain-containing protein [Caballeronia sp. LZ001]|uniref:LysR substrate-binding domain-containing protein n=1 Tax=Caballeronia sp. LZ001 TaxID=3038553 RepID=UPI00285BD9C8|nr:LysR substrate-binding domain-containing protein [Caballeronia sp. LZ001]MDR5804776.1 LysR substrate-binding domain-containing protein [Caballeronia sp. LZ001]
MDLRQLRYFVRVVEMGNVTRASESLHVAQPAVSQQIRNLERELDFQLLERSQQGVTPTAAGKSLYRHALELIRLADRTRELLLQDAEMPQGKISVGLPTSTARFLAMPLAQTIRERFPTISLELIEVPTADMASLVASDRVDLAVIPDVAQLHGVRTEHLLSEILYVIAWPEFELPNEPVSLAALARMPMVLPSNPNTIRSRVDWALREKGLACNVLFEAGTTSLLFAAVLAKIGVTVLPWTAAYQEVEDGKLKIARVDHRLFKRDLSLCWKDSGTLSNAVIKVKEVVHELFDNFGQRPEWAATSQRATSQKRKRDLS